MLKTLLIDSPRDNLCCPYCSLDHEVTGGYRGFQTFVKCSSCQKPFAVLAIATPSLKFQTAMVLEDK